MVIQGMEVAAGIFPGLTAGFELAVGAGAGFRALIRREPVPASIKKAKK